MIENKIDKWEMFVKEDNQSPDYKNILLKEVTKMTLIPGYVIHATNKMIEKRLELNLINKNEFKRYNSEIFWKGLFYSSSISYGYYKLGEYIIDKIL